MKQTTKRAGWIRRDVRDPESISDHMYRMGLMGLVMADVPGVDRDKLRDQLLFSIFKFIVLDGVV